MQEEAIELVARYCPKNCVYRGVLLGYGVPFCQYILIEGMSRNCKVSECDKYRPGRPIKPKMMADVWIEWEREYGEDADSVWSRGFERTEL